MRCGWEEVLLSLKKRTGSGESVEEIFIVEAGANGKKKVPESV